MRAPLIFISAVLFSLAAQAANADYLLTIEGVGRPAPAGPIYLKVSSTGDLDGDGLPDKAVLRMTCSAGQVTAAHLYVTGPRDAASGQASGKRMHKPFTIVKEWSAATPQLMQAKTGYNVKEAKGARVAADPEGWMAVNLSNAEALCAAAQQATGTTKTRSNIQNN